MSASGYLGGRRALQATVILVLAALVLTAKLPNTSKFLAVLNDAAHGPVFGLVSLMFANLLRQMSTYRRLFAAFLATISLGILVEAVQGMTGRDASWFDVWTDAMGALCALGLYAWRHHPQQAGPALGRLAPAIAFAAGLAIFYPVGVAASAYALRAAVFPRLLDLDAPLSLYFVETRGVEANPERLPPPWGVEAGVVGLEVKVLHGEYPGIGLVEPFPVWEGHNVLKLDVINPGDDPMPLTLRVHDRSHDNQLADRFNRTFELPPASREVLSIPLGEMSAAPRGRILDLKNVAGLILFTSGAGAEPGRTYYVTAIWLE